VNKLPHSSGSVLRHRLLDFNLVQNRPSSRAKWSPVVQFKTNELSSGIRMNSQTASPDHEGRPVALEDRVAYQCLLIASRVTRFMAPMWEQEFGLTPITWRALAVIGRFGPLSAKELAAYTSTDAFFASRAIEQLVGLKLVSRSPDPNDRRRVSLKLTRKGATIRNRVERLMGRVEHDILSRVSTAEQQHVKKVLAELNSATQFLIESSACWQDYE
jgi:DNA-binding MarR family transcriptional regulator